MLSEDFLSLMNCADVMVGNSSAAIREAPSFRLPAVNIGSRQNGRLRADNVIDVGFNEIEIKSGIEKALYDKNFQLKMKNLINPYGKGKSAEKIVDILKNISLDDKIIQKEIAYEI